MKRSTLGILTGAVMVAAIGIAWIQGVILLLIDNPNGNYGNLVLPVILLFICGTVIVLEFPLKKH
jgi:hypothetical protein